MDSQPGETLPDITPETTSLTAELIAHIYALDVLLFPVP